MTAHFPPADTTPTETRLQDDNAGAIDANTRSGQDGSASEIRFAGVVPCAQDANTHADEKGWRKRFDVRRRAILPVDLRMKPTVAAIAGAILAMLLNPPETHHTIIELMLVNVAKAYVYEKPGRSYSRRKRNGRRKGKGKGNKKEQYQRRKQRGAQKRTKPG